MYLDMYVGGYESTSSFSLTFPLNQQCYHIPSDKQIAVDTKNSCATKTG